MSLSDTFNPNGLNHQTAKPCVKRKAKRSAPFSLRLSADERARLVHEAGAAPLGAYIKAKLLGNEPGSSWKNGYNESFNSKLRDELLNAEIFTMLYEAQVLIERWRRHYNANRPYSSSDIDHRRQKRSCRQRLTWPTLRSDQLKTMATQRRVLT